MTDEKGPITAREETCQAVAPAVYLFPVAMSDEPVSSVLPARNVELMAQVKYFVVENVRTARRFLKRVNPKIDISSLHFEELNEHTDPADVTAMLAPVRAGHALGVMSEAGCPAVADPGAMLVAAAQAEGIRVVPLVGPSSILMALMGSGMNGQNFTFHGYLPVAEGERMLRLRDITSSITKRNSAHIFIETPYRNNRLIDWLARTLPGNISLCVASDITGPRESIVTRTLAQWKTSRYDYNKIPTIFVLGRQTL